MAVVGIIRKNLQRSAGKGATSGDVRRNAVGNPRRAIQKEGHVSSTSIGGRRLLAYSVRENSARPLRRSIKVIQ